MRIILWLLALLTALYCGYWVLASRGLKSGAEAALADMQAAGTGDYQSLSIGGFPYRFDVKVAAPLLASPDGAFRWTAPDLRVQALSYQPQSLIATFPKTQSLRIGQESISVSSVDLMASARVGLDTSLPLDHAESLGHEITLASSAGWGLTIDELRAAVQQLSGATEQRVGIEMTGLALSGLPAGIVTAGGILPDRGERLHLDATLTLDRPLDRYALTEGLRIRGADIRALALDWGPAGLQGQGAVTLGPDGVPEGEIALSLRNWRAVLRLTTALGLVRPESVPTVEGALEGLARLSGDVETLKLPLVFQGGRMSLGPIPLGPAPRF